MKKLKTFTKICDSTGAATAMMPAGYRYDASHSCSR